MPKLLFRPDIVREALDRLGSMSKAVHELMDQEGALRFEFHVDNHRITFSHSRSTVPREWLAVAIIRAVEEWQLVPESFTASFGGSTGTNGIAVMYDRHITFDWRQKQILTSLPPDEGDVFLQVAAYFVGDFQKQHENEQRRSGKRGTV
jgi:hypothetical protein